MANDTMTQCFADETLVSTNLFLNFDATYQESNKCKRSY